MRLVLNLGRTPLANALLREADLRFLEERKTDQETYPLVVVQCLGCQLVQITETVPPEILFSNYPYFSSFSTTTVDRARALAKKLIVQEALTENSLVVELASNDGYLLQHYLGHCRVLGVEPATNVAQEAIRKDIPTIIEFFELSKVCGRLLPEASADVVHANNVLAHVPDPNDFVAGIAVLLKPDGLAVVEVPYLQDMIKNLEFDTIYHEHMSYFSLRSIDALFLKNGLQIVDLQRLEIHGGSLRIFAKRNNIERRVSKSVTDLYKQELQDEFNIPLFNYRIQALRRELRSTLEDLKKAGKSIVAYGASAKGCTLLHRFDIGAETLEYVVDRNTHKQGMFTPGKYLEILPVETLAARRPDYVLLLTWNFAKEILEQQDAYRRAGGKFIVPLPEVVIL